MGRNRNARKNVNTKKNKPHRLFLVRLVLIGLGFLFLGLGIVGVVLPVLPTVPFLLLTSYCFTKGSEKYSVWFRATKLYKKYIYFFEKYKVMPTLVELTLLVFISTVLIVSCYFANNLFATIGISCVCLFLYLYFFVAVTPLDKKSVKELRLKDRLDKKEDANAKLH